MWHRCRTCASEPVLRELPVDHAAASVRFRISHRQVPQAGVGLEGQAPTECRMPAPPDADPVFLGQDLTQHAGLRRHRLRERSHRTVDRARLELQLRCFIDRSETAYPQMNRRTSRPELADDVGEIQRLQIVECRHGKARGRALWIEAGSAEGAAYAVESMRDCRTDRQRARSRRYAFGGAE